MPKPCPFCGADARIVAHEFVVSYSICPVEYGPDIRYRVGCRTEECYGCIDEGDLWFFTEEEAVKAWDRRSDK